MVVLCTAYFGNIRRDRGRKTARVTIWLPGVVLFVGVAAVAWLRVGLLDLPGVPRGVTVSAAGLADLPALATEDLAFRTDVPDATITDPPAVLNTLRSAVMDQPVNLVRANAYRMEVFKLRRAFLHEARQRGELTPAFPDYLDRQPIAFFEELVHTHPSRETRLSLALAWVDEMLLFPALEIKAPASVQSVDILTEILQGDDAWYVPALFARGLNHLHRPARLVWPESAKTGPDAAVKDIARCVAVGRKLDVGTPKLHATLAMTLGDAYVKAGRFDVARSWWQIAQNLCQDDDIQQAVRRRYAWHDHQMLDRLEKELDRARAQLDHPMTDLALMWK